MIHRVYVMFEETDIKGQENTLGLPSLVSKINHGLLTGYNLQSYRSRIVKAESVPEPGDDDHEYPTGVA